jgi:hypothetical protein
MVSTRYHIFISYRREDGKDTARLLKESLEYTSVPLGTKHQFGLVFDGVPESISCVNICESDTSQWKFFGVHLEEKTHIVTLDEYFFKDVLDDL